MRGLIYPLPNKAEVLKCLQSGSEPLCKLPYLVNHRCHLYQGTNTSTISAGHAMLTARRPSLLEFLYSSSIATLMMISPVSVVSGPETARNPSMREPSSESNSTCCPGSGTRGGLLLPNVISSPASRAVRAPRGSGSLRPGYRTSCGTCSRFRARRRRYWRRLRGGSHPASRASRPHLWCQYPHLRSGCQDG